MWDGMGITRAEYVRMIFAPEFAFFAETISTEGHGQTEDLCDNRILDVMGCVAYISGSAVGTPRNRFQSPPPTTAMGRHHSIRLLLLRDIVFEKWKS